MNEQEKKLKAQQDKLNIQHVMSSANGRAYVARIIYEVSGILRSSSDGAGNRTNETFINEGMRKVGLQLEKELRAITPDDYLKMLEERKDD